MTLIQPARAVLCGLAFLAATQAVARTTGDLRTNVDTIIIHAVSGPRCAGGRVVYSGAPHDAAHWKRFFDTHTVLGIHYVVDRAGVVLSSTPESREANHALNHNHGTIGIELVHNGDGIEPFSDKQLNALIELIKAIRTRYAIPIENIKSHAEMDTRTFVCGGQPIKARQDPGENFPWVRLRNALKMTDKPK
jgi:N-acetyl-anhydromuramyl-L-alanine amidase AmpD